MGNEGFFQLSLLDVRGRPVNESKVKVGFFRVADNKSISSNTEDFPPPHTFALPAFPQEKQMFCDITAPRYRMRRTGTFLLTDKETIARNISLFRRPDKWTANFTAWDQLGAPFLALRKVLERSSAVKVKKGRQLGKFTEAIYDGIVETKEVFAKAAMLNIYAKLTDLKEPVNGTAPWFSFVNEIVEISRERIIAIVDPKMGELVRHIADNDSQFKDYEKSPSGIHFPNIPSVFQPKKNTMFSIKSGEDHGNVQLTMAPGKDASGNPLLVLDADIDENGQMFAHLMDLLKHKFSGGTHPFDIHEFLAFADPNRPLGYELV